ncbi:hypothetical protein LCGC14_0560050 [marine sediment metagenome]|uniref:Uncharacterized protein n=1 Tax=marine sediment metagenome TaxID=412755 RepID=A0A0F9UVG7_9ZZZZ
MSNKEIKLLDYANYKDCCTCNSYNSGNIDKCKRCVNQCFYKPKEGLIKLANNMSHKDNIIIQKLNNRFENYESMDRNILIEDISNLRVKIFIISITLTTAIIGLLIILSALSLYILDMILIFIFIFYLLLLYLAVSIITDIIIPDKLKIYYKEAYFIYGYIQIDSSPYIETINHVFMGPINVINKFITSITSDITLKKRICFKCKEELNYIEYCGINMYEIPIEQLEKVWLSSHIEILCCKHNIKR